MNRYDIDDVQNVLNISAEDLMAFLSCVNPDEEYEFANVASIYSQDDEIMVEIVYGTEDSSGEYTEQVTLASMIEFLEN